jgi:anti-sigma B factor antagonist
VLSCTIAITDAQTTVTVSGDVDQASSGPLWDQLRPAITPATRIVVDCDGITFLDSAGLRVLVHAKHQANAHGSHFVLANPAPIVCRILDLAGVAETFTTTFDKAVTGEAISLEKPQQLD